MWVGGWVGVCEREERERERERTQKNKKKLTNHNNLIAYHFSMWQLGSQLWFTNRASPPDMHRKIAGPI